MTAYANPDPTAPKCPACGKPMYETDPAWLALCRSKGADVSDVAIWDCLNAECGETETQQELPL